MTRRGSSALLLLLLVPLVACATAPDPGWSAVAIWGTSRAAPPGDDFTSAMEATGFDETSPGLEFGGVVIPGSDHPLRDDEGNLWRLEIRRSLAGGFGAGMVAGYGELGEVGGYAEPDPDVLGAHLMLSYDVLAAAPVVTFTHALHDRLAVHLLGGPAALRVGVREEIPRGGERRDKWRVGLLGDAGVSLHVVRGFSLEGRLGYRRVGEVPVGPYTVRDFEGNEAVFPATDVRFDHAFWGLGMGWSF